MYRNPSSISWLLAIGAMVVMLASDLPAQDAQPSKPQVRGAYCGLYSLLGALAAVGKPVALERLIEPEYIGSWRGSTIAELQRAAEDMGAHAVAMAGLGAESLRAAQHPMILHLASEGQLRTYNHWVLMLGMERGQARILDAPDPVQLVPLGKLLARWDGAALIVSEKPIDTASVAADEYIQFLSYALLTGGLLVLLRFTVGHLRRKPHSAPQCFLGRLRTSGVQTALLILFALLGGTLVHAVDDSGFLQNRASMAYIAAANMDVFFDKLDIDDARQLQRQPNVVVIDARSRRSYDYGHIEGAINLPVDTREAERKQLLAKVPKDAKLLLYCQSRGCHYDERMAIVLAHDGFEQIALYPGGWKEWRGHGSRKP